MKPSSSKTLRWAVVPLLMVAAANAVFVGCGSDSEDTTPTEDGGSDGASSSGKTSSSSSSSSGVSSSSSSGASSGDGGDAGDAGENFDSGVIGIDTDGGGSCLPADSPCTSGPQCCTSSCVGSKCSATQCKADSPTAEACTTNEECCSGKCDTAGTKTCVAIAGGTCRVEGNPCTTGADCCSKQCDGTKHCSNISYCTQNGDSCASDTECCGGSCVKTGGAALGRCSNVVGTSSCNPAGTLCAGTGCNNSCCSLSCGPLGNTGINICQPPSGCKPQNELCAKSEDCCGGPGRPTGRVNGNENGYNPPKTCTVPAGETFGRCDFLQCLRPGDVCKNTKFQCGGTSNNCCEGDLPDGGKPESSFCNSNPDACCSQDALGIPRCRAVNFVCGPGTVITPGQKCATSADCCGSPCVNNQCQAACVPADGTCSNNSDCCSPNPCVIPTGSATGKCGSTSLPDAGTTDSGTDSGTGTDAGTGTCGLYGQACTIDANCCSGVPCTAGHCRYP